MQGLPQIRLRTFFFVFVCAAVGLAIGTSPKNDAKSGFTIFGWEHAELNWHFALLSAATVAVIVGLFKQAAFLKKWQPPDGIDRAAILFARQFAVFWRAAIGGLLIACLISALLLAQRVIELPETETFFSYEPFPYAVWVLCLIVVLSVSASRLQKPRPAQESSRGVVAIWVAGVLLAALILPDVALVQSLVHIATAGVEFAQPASYHWQGAFPDQRAEGFRTFWMSAAATASVVLGAACLVTLNRHPERSRSNARFAVVALLLSLLMPAAFIVWYYSREFQRISPYLASVGLASNPLEQSAGIILALLVITAGAYRLTSDARLPITIKRDIGNDNDLFLYESTACLLCFVSAVVTYIAAAIYTFLALASFMNAFWRPMRIAEMLVGMLREPGGILMIAVLLLSVQIGLMRWRRRSEQIDWVIADLPPRRFIWNWFALAALACVAVPMIAAFLFLFWLGPWYLFGP